MQINQHNYETFFLMYVDNELSVQDREMVEAFVQQHPGLGTELELLKQTVLGGEEEIEFTAKEKLKRAQKFTEEDMLTYLDGEADNELTTRLEQGMLSDNTLRREVEDLGKLYSKPDLSIKYPAKARLYKGGVVRRMDWRKLAVAASLLLCIGTWLVLNQSEDDGDGDRSPVAVNLPPVMDPVSPSDTIANSNDSNDPGDVEQSENNREAKVKEVAQDVIIKKPNATIIKEPTSLNGSSKEVNSTTTTVITGKENNTARPPVQPTEEPLSPVTSSGSPEPANPAVAVETPVKEKKSLFKKLGKQISDRALDILSDGGDNINVAGFAIQVKK